MTGKKFSDNPLYEERFRFKERNESFVFYLVLACLLLVCMLGKLYWSSRFEMVQVDGSSMNRTLSDGQWLLLDKNAQPQRGDIIVVDVRGYREFDVPSESSSARTNFLIKRLIAVEGDKVRCSRGRLEICNAETGGVWQEVDESGYAYYSDVNAYSFAEYTVGEGEVFFLGDNRNNSKDSRYQDGNSRLHALYKAEDIYGVVTPWAVEHSTFTENVFVDIPAGIQNFFGNIFG